MDGAGCQAGCKNSPVYVLAHAYGSTGTADETLTSRVGWPKQMSRVRQTNQQVQSRGFVVVMHLSGQDRAAADTRTGTDVHVGFVCSLHIDRQVHVKCVLPLPVLFSFAAFLCDEGIRSESVKMAVSLKYVGAHCALGWS